MPRGLVSARLVSGVNTVLGRATALPKYAQVAASIRAQIEEGRLLPGAPAPSGAALARATGFSNLTCRKALQTLIRNGVLVVGPSANARPRVAGPADAAQTVADAERVLSKALAGLRRAAAITQVELASIVGMSVTTVGHAETGRVWQSRDFWERADKALDARGELLRHHDDYRAAVLAGTAESETEVDDSLAAARDGARCSVTCITISWGDGTITTVYPPGGLGAHHVEISGTGTSRDSAPRP